MFRFALGFAILVGLTPALAGQEVDSPPLPKVVLSLPSGIPSESVQINYFMVGPFGGYGTYVKPAKKRSTYEIDASRDGKPARDVKVIAFLPGCDIVTLDIPIEGEVQERQLTCEPLEWILFSGQISPVSITLEKPAEIEVVYLAPWAHQFFGIIDGIVTTFRLGTVVPDKEGRFEIKLPDFYRQTTARDGELEFILREPKSGNIIAYLKPLGESGNSPRLKISSPYFPLVQFTAEKSE